MDFEFDFMHYRKIAARISIGLVLLSIVSLAVNQVEWGLDLRNPAARILSCAVQSLLVRRSVRNSLIRAALV